MAQDRKYSQVESREVQIAWVEPLVEEHLPSLELKQVVTTSKLADKSPDLQARNILTEFNKDIEPDLSAVTTSWPRGRRIPPNQFWLAHRNQKPELVSSELGLIARHVPWPWSSDTVQMIGEPFNQNSLFYGEFGTYVINVPKGNYVKAWTKAKEPLLFDEGPHVLHDKSFILAGARPEDSLVKKSDLYINHGTINILRVPVGYFAKAWFGAQPLLLGPKLSDRKHFEYICNDVQFRLETPDSPFIHINTPYIHHGKLHRLRVDSGKTVKAWFGTTPLLLGPGMLEELANSKYAAGIQKELAEIKKELREVSPGVYECDSPYFSVVADAQDKPIFFNTNEQEIQHGAIKRLIPHTGQVAITYDDNGDLHLVKTTKNGEATVIYSNKWTFNSFLPTVMQSLLFPSEATRERRMRENKQATLDEINLEVSTTSDSAKLGTKLFVAFEIEDPEKALKRFGNYIGIVDHIEKVTAAEMGNQISQRSSRDFWSYTHTKPQKPSDQESKATIPDLLTYDQPQTLQKIVEEDLRAILKKDGITLIRVNLEEVKFLDPGIAKKMSEQAIIIAETSAKEAVIDKQTELARKQAAQNAEVKRIEQEQLNAVTVSKAKADFEAADNKAKSLRVEAQAKADAMEIEAKAKSNAMAIEAKGQADSIIAIAKAKNEASSLEGQIYQTFPQVLERDKTKMVSDALGKAHVYAAPEQIGSMFAQGAGLSLFARSIGSSAPALMADKQDRKAEDSGPVARV